MLNTVYKIFYAVYGNKTIFMELFQGKHKII